jgi:AMMECR1 domain-containing protein
MAVGNASSVGIVEHPHVALARDAIRHFLSTGQLLPGGGHSQASQGVFVSLHEPGSDGSEGPLRGCVGSIVPESSSLTDEIVRQAVNAATRDPRFGRVRLRELDALVITVYLLHPAIEVAGVEDLDPHRFGVILEGPGGRRSLLLPGIPGIDSAEDQVLIARRKANVAPGEPVRLSRFTATILR